VSRGLFFFFFFSCLSCLNFFLSFLLSFPSCLFNVTLQEVLVSLKAVMREETMSSPRDRGLSSPERAKRGTIDGNLFHHTLLDQCSSIVEIQEPNLDVASSHAKSPANPTNNSGASMPSLAIPTIPIV
jgi:hypothetical protein